MMNILLINPDSPYLENAAAYPPMGLMYVAASLRNEGCKVSILDMATEPHYEIRDMKYLNFDLVGITCVTPNYPQVVEMLGRIPIDIRTMVGGIHPTLFPHDVFVETGCTHVVTGEFENVAHELIHGAIPQQIYHGGAAKIENIQKPARDLVDLHKYKPGGEDATPVYTSRGCPFSCRYCSKLPQSKYREIPLKQVMDEVDECIDHGFNNIVFGDDNIACNPHRLRNLLELLKTKDISFRLNMDSRHPAEDLFELAAKAGCTEISFGVESGSPFILTQMNKMLSPEESMRAIKMTQKYGMKAKAYFMVNYPGETTETVWETLRFAEKAKPDKWLLSAFAPLPGSFTYAHPEMFGITSMSKDWSDYYLVGKDGGFRPCFETRYLTKEKQMELHKMMYEGLKERLG